jgi:hypothetical protein
MAKKDEATIKITNNEQKNILYSLDSFLIISFLLCNLLDYLMLGSRFISDYNQLIIILLIFLILISFRIVLSILFLRNKDEEKIRNSNFILSFFIVILNFVLIILYVNLLDLTPDIITNILTIYWIIIFIINYLMR